MQMVELPGWFYDVFFPALGILVGWLFGWKLTKDGISLRAIFRRRK